MSIEKKTPIYWEDIVQLFTSLNYYRNKINLSNINYENYENEKINTELVQDLKTGLNDLTAHSNIGNNISPNTIDIPEKGSLITPFPFEQIQEELQTLSTLNISYNPKTSHFSGFKGSSFKSSNFSHNGSGFKSSNFSGFTSFTSNHSGYVAFSGQGSTDTNNFGYSVGHLNNFSQATYTNNYSQSCPSWVGLASY